MQLRSLDQFKKIHALTDKTTIVLPEEEFFGSLDSIKSKLGSSDSNWTLISHCEDQVSGFQHLDQIVKLNQLADEYKDRVRIFVISVNKLNLSENIHYYFYPEYHAIYWPLYKSMTPVRPKSIDKLFLSLNKRGDPWRQVMYKKFWQDGLLDKSYFSYLCEDDNYGTLFHEPTWKANRKWADEDFIPRFMPELEGPWPDKFLELDNDSLLETYKSGEFNTDDDPTWSADQHLFDSSFCSVIIETDIGNELVNISEKTIRALALGHPILLLGAEGTHQYLKDLGFDMFDDVFDNSFDQEWELYARFCKFINNVNKFNKYSSLALIHLKKSLYSRGMKNRAHLKTMYTKMHTKSREIVQDILHKLNK